MHSSSATHLAFQKLYSRPVPGRLTSIMTAVFVLSFALDFKGEVGGTLIQYIMAAVNTLAFISLASLFHFSCPRRGLSAYTFWIWLTFIILGSLGAFVSVVPLERYIRVVYPYVLFSEGFIVSWWVVRSNQADLNTLLIRYMIIAAVISVAFNFWWGFYFTGLGIMGVRFHVLSPLIPFLVTTSIFDLVFIKRDRLVSLGVFVLVCGVITASLTRGYLLPLIAVMMIVFIVWCGNVLSGYQELPRPFVRAMAVGLLSIALIAIASVLLSHELMQDWSIRLFGVDNEVTLWTRVAFARNEWGQLIHKPYALLIGRGFGQSFSMSPHYYNFIIVPGGASAQAFTHSMWAPGEIIWMSLLYYGGVLCGTCVCFLFVRLLFRAIAIIGALMRMSKWSDSQYRPQWIAALGFIGFMAVSTTDNTFTYRISSVFFGVCTAIITTKCRNNIVPSKQISQSNTTSTRG